MQTAPLIRKVLHPGSTGCGRATGISRKDNRPAPTPKRPIPVTLWTEPDTFPVAIQTVSRLGLSLSF